MSRTAVASAVVVPLAAVAAVLALTTAGRAQPSAKPRADLQLRLDRFPGSVAVGDRLTYGIHVRNKGPAPATVVTLVDRIPAELALVTARSSPGRCSGSSAITCSLGRLKAGRAASVTVIVQAKAAGHAVSRVSVKAAQLDPHPSDNRRSPGTVVQAPAVTGPPDVTVTVDRSASIGTGRLAVGITYTTKTLGPHEDAGANARAEGLLRNVAVFQNQHIYGFGGLNPEPSPGVFYWGALDRRLGLMHATGATPVITLCCAPDWMTRLGSDTSRYPNLPPTPAHYGDFAQLAQQVARRYPDVRYYDVWNEFKGFNKDYVAYTNFYNVVYDALKAVDPTLQVGGPYLPIGGTGDPIPPLEVRAFNYWLTNAHGADFISLDHSIVDSRERGADPATILSQTHQFETITKQIRALTPLPIWWAEDYFDARLNVLGYANHAFQAAALGSILYHEELGGAAVSLRWQPQGEAVKPFEGDQESLWSDTTTPTGGQPFPSYYVYKAFHDDFPPGTQLFAATSSSPDVEALASATHRLLINKRNAAVVVSLDGKLIALAPYEVRLV